MSRDRGADEHFTPGRPAQPERSNVDYWDGLDGTRIETVQTLNGKRISIGALTMFNDGPTAEVIQSCTHSLEGAEHLAHEILSQVAAARGEVQ